MFCADSKGDTNVKGDLDTMSVVLENKPENKLHYKVAQPKRPKKPSMGTGGSIKDFTCDKCGKKLDQMACVKCGGCTICCRCGEFKWDGKY